MSHINIRRSHNLSLEKARESAEHIAAQLNDRFQMDYYWQENTLYFERSGVHGYMDVSVTEVRIHARLGFLLTPLKSRFEDAIHRYLDELPTAG